MSREVMQQMLSALETLMLLEEEDCGLKECPECQALRPIWAAMKAGKEALNAPLRCQPRLWYHPVSGRVRSEETKGWIPLYEHPKEWRGLTNEERREMSMANRPYVIDMLEAHEEELKRRNT